MVQRAERHGLGDLRRNRAMVGEQLIRHVEQVVLGLVAVGDEAALEHIGRAGDVRSARPR